jgi:hypothetical protein
MTDEGKPRWTRGVWSRLIVSSENSPNHILVDWNIESHRNLLSYTRTTPSRITLTHLDNSSNAPVPTWGDITHKLGTYHSPFPGQANGFIIEYNQKPKM